MRLKGRLNACFYRQKIPVYEINPGVYACTGPVYAFFYTCPVWRTTFIADPGRVSSLKVKDA